MSVAQRLSLRKGVAQVPAKISIIIPAYNEEKYLAATLSSVHEAIETYDDKHSVEIIVTDNGSTDQTREIAEKHGATVVFEPLTSLSPLPVTVICGFASPDYDLATLCAYLRS